MESNPRETAPKMSKVPIFPPEIIGELFAVAYHVDDTIIDSTESRSPTDQPKRHMWELAAVSPVWWKIGRPFLFKDLEVRLSMRRENHIEAALQRLRTLISLIDHSPEIASFVQNLTLEKKDRCYVDLLDNLEYSELLYVLVRKLPQVVCLIAKPLDRALILDYEAGEWWNGVTRAAQEAVTHVCRLPGLQHLEIAAFIPLSVYIHHPNLRSLTLHGSEVTPRIPNTDGVDQNAFAAALMESLPMLTTLKLETGFTSAEDEDLATNTYFLQHLPLIFTHLTELHYTCDDRVDAILPQTLTLARNTLTSLFCDTCLQVEPTIDLSPLTQLRCLHLSYIIIVDRRQSNCDDEEEPNHLKTFRSMLATLRTVHWDTLTRLSLKISGTLPYHGQESWDNHWRALEQLIVENAAPNIQEVDVKVDFRSTGFFVPGSETLYEEDIPYTSRHTLRRGSSRGITLEASSI